MRLLGLLTSLGGCRGGGEKGSTPDSASETPSDVRLEWDDGTLVQGSCLDVHDVEVSSSGAAGCAATVIVTGTSCGGIQFGARFADRRVGTASTVVVGGRMVLWSDTNNQAQPFESTHEWGGMMSVEAWDDQLRSFRLSDGDQCGYGQTDDCVPLDGRLTIEHHIGATESERGLVPSNWVDVATGDTLCAP